MMSWIQKARTRNAIVATHRSSDSTQMIVKTCAGERRIASESYREAN